MEKKLNFTSQALNQINKIAIGDDKKFFRITVQGGVVRVLNTILVLILG